MKIILTFDLEEARHMHIGGGKLAADSSGFRTGLSHLLELLAHAGARGTFFVVGELAQDYPDLIKRISEAGHELAFHSFSHKHLGNTTPAEFEEDLIKGKALLEKISGRKIIGYRAPSWSAHIRKTPWLWEILKKNGFEYSSSIAPVRTPLYGDVTAAPYPHFKKTSFGEVLEIPLPTRRFLIRMPFSGGFYFRVLPSWLRHKMEQDWKSSGLPLMYYFHLRDLGFEKIPLGLPLAARAVNYWGARGAKKNFDLLLESGVFGTIRDFLPQFRDFAGRE